jgi:hypothetical protein
VESVVARRRPANPDCTTNFVGENRGGFPTCERNLADPKRRGCGAFHGAVTEKIRIEQHSVGGLLWLFGWLFTIGLLNLTFWKGFVALLVWPVFLGYALSPLLQSVAHTP